MAQQGQMQRERAQKAGSVCQLEHNSTDDTTGSSLARALGRGQYTSQHRDVSKVTSYAASARNRALETSLKTTSSRTSQSELEISQLTKRVSQLTQERLQQQQLLSTAKEHTDSLLGKISSAGVNTHWVRRELRGRSASFTSSCSSSSRSSTSSYSPASSSCASAPSASPFSSPSQTSTSSSADSSPAVSRGNSAKVLRLQADTLQQELQAGVEKLRATRSRAAALAEQLPVIEALIDQPARADSFAATAAAPRSDSHAARLATIGLHVGVNGSPPIPVPLLHPSEHHAGATLLKCDTWRPKDPLTGRRGAREARAGTSAVWLLHSDGGEQYIVKIEPCLSAEAAAKLAAARLLHNTSGKKLVPLRTTAEALLEAVNAACINDACAASAPAGAAGSEREPVLPPSAVFLRDCSLQGTDLDMGHDKEVVILYPFCPSGDAYVWLGNQAECAARTAARGAKGMKAAAEAVTRKLYSMVVDMLRAVAAVHHSGWVLGDHKPENMVWSHMQQCWALIDAAGASCCLGSRDGWLQGCGTYTEIYAAPEQLDEHAPRRGQPSDVFTCGASVEELVELAAQRFGEAAEEAWWKAQAAQAAQGQAAGAQQQGRSRRSLRSAARSAAWRASTAVRVAARRLGLSKLVSRCTKQDPAKRSTIDELCRAMEEGI